VARWGPEDRIRAYAVAGGMPAYLERFDDRHPFRYELYRMAYSPDGRLFQEAPELLDREFTEPRTYESVLRAIAAGYVTPTDIAQQAGLAGADRVGPYLERLIALGLVNRLTLPSEAREVRPRISQYVLADHYLRFYFALVDPWRSAVQQGRGGAVLEHLWPVDFDRFVSRTFEDVALRYLLRLSGTGRLSPVSAAGRWWFTGGGDIDAVAMTGNAMTAAAEAKWTNEYFKPSVDLEYERETDALVERAHVAAAQARRIERSQFASMPMPSSVRIDSGWNWMPSTGCSRWRMPITSPSGAVAVTSRTSGSVVAETASEW
jgi:AAA+ ATPase superfamily predicted ATPase